MKDCLICNKKVRNCRNFHDINICSRCYSKINLKELKGRKPPDDKYWESVLPGNYLKYADALNVYATTCPRDLSPALFGIFFTNLDKEDMDYLFINASIIAARAVLLFGYEKPVSEEQTANVSDPNRVHFLTSLGHLISITIIGELMKKYTGLELDMEDSDIIDELYDEYYLLILNALNDIRQHDDGRFKKLRKYIIETYRLIRSCYKIYYDGDSVPNFFPGDENGNEPWKVNYRTGHDPSYR